MYHSITPLFPKLFTFFKIASIFHWNPAFAQWLAKTQLLNLEKMFASHYRWLKMNTIRAVKYTTGVQAGNLLKQVKTTIENDLNYNLRRNWQKEKPNKWEQNCSWLHEDLGCDELYEKCVSCILYFVICVSMRDLMEYCVMFSQRLGEKDF